MLPSNVFDTCVFFFLTLQICSSGNPNYAFTNTYNCPQPLKGKYVTFQKVQQTAENPGWSMYINEVNVDAVSF